MSTKHQAPSKTLRNWNGTVHYSMDGTTPACGPLATHGSWLAPSDEPATCERCLARFGVVEVEPLPVAEPSPRERREAERAARRAARAEEPSAAPNPVTRSWVMPWAPEWTVRVRRDGVHDAVHRNGVSISPGFSNWLKLRSWLREEVGS